MAIFLDRIDTYSPAAGEFNFLFSSWIAVLIDTLNETIVTIQNSLNLPTMPGFTSAQITTLSPNWANGIIVYDTDLDVYVGKQAGTLVQFTTAAYP